MMGLAYRSYAFLHARLGALKAELLTARQWEQLLQASSFMGQRQVLEATAYAPWLEGTAEGTAGRLRAALHYAARTIERCLAPEAARLIRVWGDRDRLRSVKTILRGKALGRPADSIAAELPDLGPTAHLPIELLLGSASVEAALDLLESTDLRYWIREARHIARRDPTLFGLDAALDRIYYVMLWRQLEPLAPPDRAAAAQIIRREVDQVNLLWLLRYRLNYRLSPAETYYLLTPVTGRLDANRLKLLVQQESLEAVVTRLDREPYGSLLAPCTSIGQVEVVFWHFRARQARRTLRRAAFTLGEALALLELKDMEIRDLTATIEAARLGISPQDLREQLTLISGFSIE